MAEIKLPPFYRIVLILTLSIPVDEKLCITMKLKDSNPSFAAIGKSVLFCLVVTVLLRAALIPMSSVPNEDKGLVWGLAGVALTLLATYLFLRPGKTAVSGIRLQSIPPAIKKFTIGLFIGVVVFGLLILCVVYFSGLKIRLNSSGSVLYLSYAVIPTVLLALMEEIAFRGYPLVILKNNIGAVAAILITSILFGLYHLAFGWTLTAFCWTSIWGALFGASAIYSNGISMPTGIHTAINLAQLSFGITGSAQSIWNVVDRNGLHIRDFPDSRLGITIAQLSLLTFVVICTKYIIAHKRPGFINKPS